MLKESLLLSVVSVVFFLFACADNEVSKEDRIRQYVEAGKQAAESRSASALADLIHQSYRDHKGMDKQSIIKLARAYFFRHKNIHLFIKIDEIVFQEENQAFVRLHVAMAGNVISDASALLSLRARIYQFELQLIKDGDWLLQQARWKKAMLKDII